MGIYGKDARMAKQAVFARYLRRLQQQHSTSVNEFAQRLDVDPTHLSRAMGTQGRPFDVHGCFRLAELTAENPSEVLRAAGKGDLAERIERLYGRPQKQKAVSPRLREVCTLWEQIEASGKDEEGLEIILTMLRRSLENLRARPTQRPTGHNGTRRARHA